MKGTTKVRESIEMEAILRGNDVADKNDKVQLKP